MNAPLDMAAEAEKQAAYEYLRAQRRDAAKGGNATFDFSESHVAPDPAPAAAGDIDLATVGCPSPEECMANGCAKTCLDEKPAVEPQGTRAGALLRTAAGIVDGARNVTHGDKERSFRAIADLWSVYLDQRPKTRLGSGVTASDVAAMMILLKLARSLHGQHVEDHAVDAAGYSAIWGELREGEAG